MEFTVKMHVEIEKVDDSNNDHPHSWAEAMVKHAKKVK